jgi:hypothetical protein
LKRSGKLVVLELFEKVFGGQNLFSRDRRLHPGGESVGVVDGLASLGKSEGQLGNRFDLVEDLFGGWGSSKERSVLEDGLCDILVVF